MKRRDFLRTAGATAAIGALPVQGAAAIAAHRTRYGMSPYVWARYTARINRKLTPDMLKSFLGFSDGEAASMIRQLTFENILVAPDASGVSRARADYLAAARNRSKALKRVVEAMRAQFEPDEPVQPGDGDVVIETSAPAHGGEGGEAD